MKRCAILGTLLAVSHFMLGQNVSGPETNYFMGNIHFVSIDLPGEIELLNRPGEHMTVVHKVEVSGHIWGMTNKNEGNLYHLKMTVNKDTLYLTARNNDFWTIGISTYQEKITQQIYLPPHVSVAIRAQGQLTVNGRFDNLRAVNGGSTRLIIQRADLKRLRCNVSGGELSFNGTLRPGSYEFEGPGLRDYFIESHDAAITMND